MKVGAAMFYVEIFLYIFYISIIFGIARFFAIVIEKTRGQRAKLIKEHSAKLKDPLTNSEEDSFDENQSSTGIPLGHISGERHMNMSMTYKADQANFINKIVSNR